MKIVYDAKDLYMLNDPYTINGAEMSSQERRILNRHLRASSNGEFRPPKKGEWYLSGSIPAAYQAKEDLSDSFHIAEIYEVREEKIIIVERKMP